MFRIILDIMDSVEARDIQHSRKLKEAVPVSLSGKNDDNLLIATNYHVVEGADTVSVTCIDGETYEATVNGYDEDKDLAVVSVALSDISDDTMDQIQVATMGSSDDLKVGEQVVAIGNALGYGQSVTTGIVSAKTVK